MYTDNKMNVFDKAQRRLEEAKSKVYNLEQKLKSVPWYHWKRIIFWFKLDHAKEELEMKKKDLQRLF